MNIYKNALATNQKIFIRYNSNTNICTEIFFTPSIDRWQITKKYMPFKAWIIYSKNTHDSTLFEYKEHLVKCTQIFANELSLAK